MASTHLSIVTQNTCGICSGPQCIVQNKVLSKHAFCTMVMFLANLGAVRLSCHPLCHPKGGEDSPAAFKWVEGVCVWLWKGNMCEKVAGDASC